MSNNRSPIQEIVEATGLPSELWASVGPPLFPKIVGLDYEMDEYMPEDRSYGAHYQEGIKIHEKTIAALQHLPAAQVLGQATLVRTPNRLTAMISIAEAATLSMDENYCQIMWIMMQLIERTLRSGGDGRSNYSWKEEIPYNKYLNQQNLGLITDEVLALEVIEMKKQQIEFQVEIGAIRRQNDEILRLLTEIYHGSREQKSSKLAQPQVTAPLNIAAAEESTKNYQTCFGLLVARKKDGQWFLCPSTFGEESKPFAVLLDWLETHLGGTSFRASSVFPQFLQLGDENEFLAREALVPKFPKETSGCWRRKILSGNVMEMPTRVKGTSGSQSGAQSLLHNPEMSDCLILTAAALWSLYDNSLERVPNCQCTFRAAGGDFIQCRSKQGNWFIWHSFSNETLCEGKNCDGNVRIALNAEEAGQRLHTTSPCALGWSALGKHSPNITLWKTLKASAEFKQKKLVKYKVKEFQALAQLSVPLVVTPQLGGAVTFSKQNYEIANSIDHNSIMAVERAAASVVLIFDEMRGIHLTCDGADVIEMCCVQFLREIGCNTLSLPPFSHSSALLRLQTWYCSNFVSARGTYFTGDHLVRQATRKISELIETTKRASREDAKLLYWLLEDVLRDSSGQALQAPRCQHASWHKLAFAAPPLILVVGELDARFLSMSSSILRWCASESKLTHTLKLRKKFDLTGIFDNHSAPGGIAGSQEIMNRWLVQGHAYTQAKLIPTDDKFIYGNGPLDSEHTHEVNEDNKDNTEPVDSVFAHCKCTQTETQRCLHYIQ